MNAHRRAMAAADRTGCTCTDMEGCLHVCRWLSWSQCGRRSVLSATSSQPALHQRPASARYVALPAHLCPLLRPLSQPASTLSIALPPRSTPRTFTPIVAAALSAQPVAPAALSGQPVALAALPALPPVLLPRTAVQPPPPPFPSSPSRAVSLQPPHSLSSARPRPHLLLLA